MSCCSHSYYAAPPCGHAWSCKRSSICRCKLANASTCICSRQLLILNLAGFHRAYRNERTLPCQIHCVVTQDAEVSTLPRIEVLLQLDTVGLATVISLRSYNIFEQLMYLFPWTCVVPCMSDWTCSHCPPVITAAKWRLEHSEMSSTTYSRPPQLEDGICYSYLVY